MKKFILIIAFFLIAQCGKSDTDYVENCADWKNKPYWEKEKNRFIEERNDWILKKSLSKDKYEIQAKQKIIDIKQYYIDLYSKAHKKSLDQKLSEFTSYASNFKSCEKEFKENPIYFKKIYN
jgi:hypothetical protein